MMKKFHQVNKKLEIFEIIKKAFFRIEITLKKLLRSSRLELAISGYVLPLFGNRDNSAANYGILVHIY